MLSLLKDLVIRIIIDDKTGRFFMLALFFVAAKSFDEEMGKLHSLIQQDINLNHKIEDQLLVTPLR